MTAATPDVRTGGPAFLAALLRRLHARAGLGMRRDSEKDGDLRD